MFIPPPLKYLNRYRLLQLCFSTLFAIISSAPLAQTTSDSAEGRNKIQGSIDGNGVNLGSQPSSPNNGERMERRPSSSSPLEQQQLRFMELEKQLELTDKQRPLWDTYRQRIDALNADLIRNPKGMVSAKDNSLQQVNRQIDLARNRLTALEDIGDAASALYRTLSPAQQKVADKLLAATLPDVYGTPAPTNASRPESSSRGGGFGGPPGMGGGGGMSGGIGGGMR